MSNKRKQKSSVNENTIEHLEVPEEIINDVVKTIQFDTTPVWIPSAEMCPPLDVFLVDSDFYKELNCFRQRNGIKLNEDQERQLKSKIIRVVISGVYDTEEKYVWLICCVCRIFLQKIRESNGLILKSDVFRRYNCEALYCPVKMHQVSKELYQLTEGNVFSIARLVQMLFHVNPVLHYICICLVSAGMHRVCLNQDPKIFKPLQPLDVISLSDTFNFTTESIDFAAVNKFLKLIALYNNLVVMNRRLSDTHSQELVEYFLIKGTSYMKIVKKWLVDASCSVDKAMIGKQMSPSLVALKQDLLIELQFGLRDNLNVADMK